MNLKIQPLNIDLPREKLAVEVPRFPSGPFCPPKEDWKPLYLEQDIEGDFPVFWQESDMWTLIRDEARYRLESVPHWLERCWFLPGTIVRDPAGHLWGMIRKALPAADLISTPSSFEFGAETWAKLREEMEENELTLGWVHSHSLEFLRASEEVLPGEGISPRQRAGRAPEKSRKTSGLFLSTFDTDSALKRGFNAPYQLTFVLDSDACVLPEEKISLQEALGVWGWFRGNLCRRSIHVIKDER
jgi:hypothetical protein